VIRIGINALAWVPGQQAGVETYLREMTCAFQEIDGENEYVFFVGREAQGQLELHRNNFREVISPAPSRWRAARVAWEQTALARQVAEEKVGVLLCSGGLVPGNLGIPAVQVIHDLQVYHYPENFSWVKRRYLRGTLPRSARAASRIIASSQYTHDDIIKLLHQPEGKIRVVPLAGGTEYQPASAEDVARVKRKHGIAGHYLLSVGTTHRHKNLPGLVHTFDRLETTGERECELLLVGKPGAGQKELQKAISRARKAKYIKLLGRAPAEDLAALYSGASALVLPSLFEGFGMTVLEAMQCGCPVACSSLTALPEVVGEAALLFDPRDKAGFGRAVERIVVDEALRRQLREKGFARASGFSWERTARQTIDALFEAAGAADVEGRSKTGRRGSLRG